MYNMKCIENYIDANNKVRKAVLFGAATAGVAAGAYIGIRKITQFIENKKAARYYEDEIEEIFKEKEKMKFYEEEFIRQEKEEQDQSIRQEKEEQVDLEKAVNEFNSRRLKREECPHCGSKDGKMKNKKREKDVDLEEEKDENENEDEI